MKSDHWTTGLTLIALMTGAAFEVLPATSVQAQSGSRPQPQSQQFNGGSRSNFAGRGPANLSRLNQLQYLDQLNAQQGSSSVQPGTRSSNAYERKLWTWLMRVEYRNWAPKPEQLSRDYPGEVSTDPNMKLYLNRKAAGNPKSLPHGSMIIEENYASDGRTPKSIKVSYRVKGHSSSKNDWYWVEFTPQGRVEMTSGRR